MFPCDIEILLVWQHTTQNPNNYQDYANKIKLVNSQPGGNGAVRAPGGVFHHKLFVALTLNARVKYPSLNVSINRDSAGDDSFDTSKHSFLPAEAGVTEARASRRREEVKWRQSCRCSPAPLWCTAGSTRPGCSCAAAGAAAAGSSRSPRLSPPLPGCCQTDWWTNTNTSISGGVW